MCAFPAAEWRLLRIRLIFRSIFTFLRELGATVLRMHLVQSQKEHARKRQDNQSSVRARQPIADPSHGLSGDLAFSGLQPGLGS